MGDSVLLAVTAGTRARLNAALGSHSLAWVETLDEVGVALAGRRFDLIVIGARFDESHAFEVLRSAIAAQPRARVACLRGVEPPSLLGKPAVEAFRVACEALGATLVLDLADYPDDDTGNRAMRDLLEHELELVA
jgi:hypothetical protein